MRTSFWKLGEALRGLIDDVARDRVTAVGVCVVDHDRGVSIAWAADDEARMAGLATTLVVDVLLESKVEAIEEALARVLRHASDSR